MTILHNLEKNDYINGTSCLIVGETDGPNNVAIRTIFLQAKITGLLLISLSIYSVQLALMMMMGCAAVIFSNLTMVTLGLSQKEYRRGLIVATISKYLVFSSLMAILGFMWIESYPAACVGIVLSQLSYFLACYLAEKAQWV